MPTDTPTNTDQRMAALRAIARVPTDTPTYTDQRMAALRAIARVRSTLAGAATLAEEAADDNATRLAHKLAADRLAAVADLAERAAIEARTAAQRAQLAHEAQLADWLA